MSTTELYSQGLHFVYVKGSNSISVRKSGTDVIVHFPLRDQFQTGREFDQWCSGYLSGYNRGGWGGLL